ncbi:hypothetical protein THAOC_20963 [Thalassiosira oceanica]|uniref:Uncharacterized protein n=1 Tax=Thalassiosira oceanica TaxID=159749 RepID=K0S243_THAOC|nr:hypothetical protein THAOC_20963 [Thalassiosira oceanica]|eukprot:EJK58879.1 hypothetical protein THAOC_20963 [Thalassiosira oceanica]
MMDFNHFLQFCRIILPKGKHKPICNQATCTGVKLSLAFVALEEWAGVTVKILSQNKNFLCSGHSQVQGLRRYLNNKFTPSLNKYPDTYTKICNSRKDFPSGGSIVLILQLSQESLAELVMNGTINDQERNQVGSNNGKCFPIARLGVLQHPELINDVFVTETPAAVVASEEVQHNSAAEESPDNGDNGDVGDDDPQQVHAAVARAAGARATHIATHGEEGGANGNEDGADGNEDKHGDCIVPYKYGELGSWDRLDRLKQIGVDLSPPQGPVGSNWNLNKHSENGDCNVPKRHKPLGSWVHYQGRHYKKGKLSEEILNSDVHMSSSGDDVPDNSDGLTESSPAGDGGEAGELNAAGKNAPDNGASASMMPPLSNLAESVSESESSGLPPSITRMSNTSNQEDLIQPDETYATGNEADRGNRKPGSFVPDSAPSSCQYGGDDETVCTTEDSFDSQDEDGGSNNTNEHTAGGNGALKARIEELEAENHAKDEMMKALEAVNRAKDEKIKALEAYINVKDERMKTKDERMKALAAANHAKDDRMKALQDEIAHFRRASPMPNIPRGWPHFAKTWFQMPMIKRRSYLIISPLQLVSGEKNETESDEPAEGRIRHLAVASQEPRRPLPPPAASYAPRPAMLLVALGCVPVLDQVKKRAQPTQSTHHRWTACIGEVMARCFSESRMNFPHQSGYACDFSIRQSRDAVRGSQARQATREDAIRRREDGQMEGDK